MVEIHGLLLSLLFLLILAVGSIAIIAICGSLIVLLRTLIKNWTKKGATLNEVGTDKH